MTVGELKAKLPLSDVTELREDTKYLLRFRSKLPLRALGELQKTLEAFGLNALVVDDTAQIAEIFDPQQLAEQLSTIGDKIMAAIDDLTKSVNDLTTAVTSTTAEIQTLAAQIKSPDATDQQIESAATQIEGLVTNLNAAVAAAQPAPPVNPTPGQTSTGS